MSEAIFAEGLTKVYGGRPLPQSCRLAEAL